MNVVFRTLRHDAIFYLLTTIKVCLFTYWSSSIPLLFCTIILQLAVEYHIDNHMEYHMEYHMGYNMEYHMKYHMEHHIKYHLEYRMEYLMEYHMECIVWDKQWCPE